MFGIGGGAFVIPALVVLCGFDQKMAAGTTLGMLLPPIGIAAFWQYYKADLVNVPAVLLLVAGFLAGSYLSAGYAIGLPSLLLKRAFGGLIDRDRGDLYIDGEIGRWYHARLRRDVAQPGRAPGSGPGGRWFKSSHPDHEFPRGYGFPVRSPVFVSPFPSRRSATMNLARLLSETAARNPGKPAVVFEGTPCTYGAFDREVERYAAMLHAAGVGKGDRVAVQLPKRMEFLFLHLANLSVGAVTLPLNTDYRPEEVEYFLSDSGTSLFVTDAERFARAAGSIRDCGGSEPSSWMAEAGPGRKACSSGSPTYPPDSVGAGLPGATTRR